MIVGPFWESFWDDKSRKWSQKQGAKCGCFLLGPGEPPGSGEAMPGGGGAAPRAELAT